MVQGIPHTPEPSERVDSPGRHELSPTRRGTREMYNGIPMPISADPNVPDPTSQFNDSSGSLVPMILSLPGTPSLVLSPAGSPGVPTPVSVPVPTAILKVMQMQQSLSANSASGLFTPANGSESGPGTPNQQPDGTETSDIEDSSSKDKPPKDSLSVPLTVEIENDGKGQMVDHPGTDEVLSNGQTLSPEIRVEESLEPQEPDHPGVLSSPEHWLNTEANRHSRDLSPPLLPIVHRPEPTTPTLHSDPYPYSLSTPGSGFVNFDHESDDDHESLSEEENDRSMSSSSSTRKKNSASPKRATSGDEHLSDFELSYPSEGETQTEDVYPRVEDDVFDVHHQGSTIPDPVMSNHIDTVLEHTSPQETDAPSNDDPFRIIGDHETDILVDNKNAPEADSCHMDRSVLDTTQPRLYRLTFLSVPPMIRLR